MEYTGVVRTTLRPEEKKDLKKIASAKGMTFTGCIDMYLREAIRKEKEVNHGNGNSNI